MAQWDLGFKSAKKQRQQSDSPQFWIGVSLGSIGIHLLAFVCLRGVFVNSEFAANLDHKPIAIEIFEIEEITEAKPTTIPPSQPEKFQKTIQPEVSPTPKLEVTETPVASVTPIPIPTPKRSPSPTPSPSPKMRSPLASPSPSPATIPTPQVTPSATPPTPQTTPSPLPNPIETAKVQPTPSVTPSTPQTNPSPLPNPIETARVPSNPSATTPTPQTTRSPLPPPPTTPQTAKPEPSPLASPAIPTPTPTQPPVETPTPSPVAAQPAPSPIPENSPESQQPGGLTANINELRLTQPDRDIPDQLATPQSDSQELSAINYLPPTTVILNQPVIVEVVVVIWPDGQPEVFPSSTKVLQGDLDAIAAGQLAKEIIEDWSFEPTYMGGQAVAQEYYVQLKITPIFN
ncbi:MAG: hypothetical protein ACOC0N_11085 [Chroococcales cyanobacterium]